MTYRDFYTAVIADTENEELKAFATEAIAKLDARNASRASKPSKRSLENEPIKAKILEVLTSEPKVASEVAELVGISTQKASALLRQIDGLEVTEVKVPKKKLGDFFLENFIQTCYVQKLFDNFSEK